MQDRVEFHQRFALPFACIAFVFVGLPLGVSTTRGSKSMGLVLSLILMFLYYLGFMGGTKLASDSNFSPFLGAWIPNFVFLLVGIFMMSRADREHENKILLGIRSVRRMDWSENGDSEPNERQHLPPGCIPSRNAPKCFASSIVTCCVGSVSTSCWSSSCLSGCSLSSHSLNCFRIS